MPDNEPKRTISGGGGLIVRSFFAALLLTGSVSMAGDAQQVTSLAPKDVERLEHQRQAIEKYLGDERSKENYKTAAGKLGLLRALIEQGVFKPTQTYQLQSMGIVLGDAFVQELGLEWVIVQDAYGRDPAVRVPKTSIIVFPLTMISKRIEKGEKVDVFELFNAVAHDIEARRKKEA
jgi:hypothetical protein